MRITVARTYFLAAAVAAQSWGSLPGCSLSCLEATEQNTNCLPDDFACICKHFDFIESAAAGCIMTACGKSVATGYVTDSAQTVNNSDTWSDYRESSSVVNWNLRGDW